jgi:predicted transcriptional regulator
MVFSRVFLCLVCFGGSFLGSYRGRLDIIADILNVVSVDAKKTQIMYRANLSYAVMQKYLAELNDASLINFMKNRMCYVITEKGLEFLRAYHEYSKTNKRVTKRLSEARIKKKALEKLCSGA